MSFCDIQRWKSEGQVSSHGTKVRKVSLEPLSQRNYLQIPGFLHKNYNRAPTRWKTEACSVRLGLQRRGGIITTALPVLSLLHSPSLEDGQIQPQERRCSRLNQTLGNIGLLKASLSNMQVTFLWVIWYLKTLDF